MATAIDVCRIFLLPSIVGDEMFLCLPTDYESGVMPSGTTKAGAGLGLGAELELLPPKNGIEMRGAGWVGMVSAGAGVNTGVGAGRSMTGAGAGTSMNGAGAGAGATGSGTGGTYIGSTGAGLGVGMSNTGAGAGAGMSMTGGAISIGAFGAGD